MDGACHNAFVQAKVKTTYDEVSKALEKLHGKKKNSPKHRDSLVEALEKLTYFQASLDLVPLLLDFLQGDDDDKVVRLALYTLSTLAPAHNEYARYMDQIHARYLVEAQMGGLRGVVAMQSFSAFEHSLTGKPLTLDKMRSVIKHDDAGDGDERKGKEKKKHALGVFKHKLHKKSDEAISHEALTELAGYLFLFRAYLVPSVLPADVPAIVQALKFSAAPTVGHALALTARLINVHPSLMREPVDRVLRDERDKLCLTDAHARVQFARLCGEFAERNNAYATELYQLLADESQHVAFAAMSALLRTEWSALTTEVKLKKADLAEPVYKIMVHRLKSAFDSDDNPTVHMACRIAWKMAEKYIVHFYTSQSGKERRQFHVVARESHPLWFLHQKMLQLHEKATLPSFIRLKILQALIWLSYAEDTSALEQTIVTSITSLPSHLFNLILEELRRRVSVLTTTDFSDTTLHLFHSIFKTNPGKIDPEMLMSVWRTIISFGEKGRIKVLQSIMAFTDTLAAPAVTSGQHVASYNYLKKSIFWFLGEYANVLAGEAAPVRDTKGLLSPRNKSGSKADKRPSRAFKAKKKDDKDDKNDKDKEKFKHRERKSRVLPRTDGAARELVDNSVLNAADANTASSESRLREHAKATTEPNTPSKPPASGTRTEPTSPMAKSPSSSRPTSPRALRPSNSVRNLQFSKDMALSSPIPNKRPSILNLNIPDASVSPRTTLADRASARLADTDRARGWYTQRDIVSASSSATHYGTSLCSFTVSQLPSDNHCTQTTLNSVMMPFGCDGLTFPIVSERKHADPSGFTYAELTPNFVEQSLQRGLGHFEDLGGLGGVSGPVALPTVGNLLMDQILLRLEYALGFSEWEVRQTCLEALAKIAFRSPYRIRLHLYSFFQLLLRGALASCPKAHLTQLDNAIALSSAVMPIFATLHKLLAALEHLEQQNYRPSPWETEMRNQLTAEIKRYCEVPPNFDPFFIQERA